MRSHVIPTAYFGLIAITGQNAATFLQGQLTCDVHGITETQGSLGACCDHKGRMIANFFIFQKKENYYLLLPESMMKLTIDHLKKYAVFSKIELIPTELKVSEYQISEIKFKEIDENTWRTLNIRSGLVWIYPETSGVLIPQMINLQKWNGVSFTKGCYVGQEIIARTEHLGKLKRHLYHAHVKSEAAPKPGDQLKNQNEQTVGIVVEAAAREDKEHDLLAVIQDSAVDNNIIFDNSLLSFIPTVRTQDEK